jgi:hypothetical protein
MTVAEKIISELRTYAVDLRTYTVAHEQLDARPLRQLLEDAAQVIAIRSAQSDRDSCI